MDKKRYYLEPGDKVKADCTLVCEAFMGGISFELDSWEGNAYGPHGEMLYYDGEKDEYYEEF